MRRIRALAAALALAAGLLTLAQAGRESGSIGALSQGVSSHHCPSTMGWPDPTCRWDPPPGP